MASRTLPRSRSTSQLSRDTPEITKRTIGTLGSHCIKCNTICGSLLVLLGSSLAAQIRVRSFSSSKTRTIRKTGANISQPIGDLIDQMLPPVFRSTSSSSVIACSARCFSSFFLRASLCAFCPACFRSRRTRSSATASSRSKISRAFRICAGVYLFAGIGAF